MKNFWTILLLTFFLYSCNQNNTKKAVPETTNFDWLIGEWQRLNDEEGKQTFEHWKKISDLEYSGLGFTMQNGDTIKQEKIKIIYHNDRWDLIVKVPEETEAITFNISDVKANEFTSKNDSLDFPKQIKYWKKGENIYALVAGDEMEINFEFEQLK